MIIQLLDGDFPSKTIQLWGYPHGTASDTEENLVMFSCRMLLLGRIGEGGEPDGLIFSRYESGWAWKWIHRDYKPFVEAWNKYSNSIK